MYRNMESGMSAIKISEKLSVSPQPSVDVIRSLRSLGFTTLINNRPDAEDALQPGTDAEKQAAEHCGRCCHVNWATVACLTVWA
jgi:uncharacterized protein (TIGR01244 family)